MEWLQETFAVNAFGPALMAKHFAALLLHDELSIFASMSARVGSIGDNRLGGWYSYRASKAALNMFTKTLSLEFKRRNKQSVCVTLHPGTVDTGTCVGNGARLKGHRSHGLLQVYQSRSKNMYRRPSCFLPSTPSRSCSMCLIGWSHKIRGSFLLMMDKKSPGKVRKE